MFEREHHRKILVILNHLNADFLLSCGVYFGGGTLVSLKHGEHRLSQDIDLMCSFDDRYSSLRREISDHGYPAIFHKFDNITLPREIQADRYGIRFPVVVDGTPIKLEIVPEGLIEFGSPDFPTWGKGSVAATKCHTASESFSGQGV
ncbi:MAG: nucleotidyl transferase AbiEii/AbiGii toxin family protein [Chroococcidiopsidaceae cyanobacterium CP_BM_ER_R8_30]|nr:nucleotidyl transferase AbiEii/AbiGii toxin family protein [Chroococcidiopsidaceae cyanobacterium CP_BM_ER_R8_30]